MSGPGQISLKGARSIRLVAMQKRSLDVFLGITVLNVVQTWEDCIGGSSKPSSSTRHQNSAKRFSLCIVFLCRGCNAPIPFGDRQTLVPQPPDSHDGGCRHCYTHADIEGKLRLPAPVPMHLSPPQQATLSTASISLRSQAPLRPREMPGSGSPGRLLPARTNSIWS